MVNSWNVVVPLTMQHAVFRQTHFINITWKSITRFIEMDGSTEDMTWTYVMLCRVDCETEIILKTARWIQFSTKHELVWNMFHICSIFVPYLFHMFLGWRSSLTMHYGGLNQQAASCVAQGTADAAADAWPPETPGDPGDPGADELGQGLKRWTNHKGMCTRV